MSEKEDIRKFYLNKGVLRQLEANAVREVTIVRKLISALDAKDKDNARLQEWVEALEKQPLRLREYLRHHDWCCRITNRWNPAADCNCGLIEGLSALEAKP